jgi:hypothetical protein
MTAMRAEVDVLDADCHADSRTLGMALGLRDMMRSPLRPSAVWPSKPCAQREQR